jgi:large subunit ribosomal protein L13
LNCRKNIYNLTVIDLFLKFDIISWIFINGGKYMMHLTKFAKPGEIERKWVLINAEGQSIGRVAAVAVSILRGKDKPIFSPNVIVGDNVVIINAASVKVTGRKNTKKIYYKHSGYVGNMKTYLLKDILQTRPEFALEHAVRLMLPKNKLGRRMLKSVRIYKDANYPTSFKINREIKVSEEE